MSSLLGSERFEVYSVDISDKGLRLLESVIRKYKLRANLITGDIYENCHMKTTFSNAIISIQLMHRARREKD